MTTVLTDLLASIVMLLSISAPGRVGVLVAEVQGLSTQETIQFRNELMKTTQEVTGHRAIADEHESQTIGERDISEIATRTEADEILIVRSLSGATQGRLVLERASPAEGITRRVQIDYPLDSRQWSTMLGGALRVLFTQPFVCAECVEAPPPPAPKPTTPERAPVLLGWIAVGAGVAFGGTGTAFRFSANGARDDANNVASDAPGRGELEDRAGTHGLASNLLLGAGAVLITGGLVYVLTH